MPKGMTAYIEGGSPCSLYQRMNMTIDRLAGHDEYSFVFPDFTRIQITLNEALKRMITNGKAISTLRRNRISSFRDISRNGAAGIEYGGSFGDQAIQGNLEGLMGGQGIDGGLHWPKQAWGSRAWKSFVAAHNRYHFTKVFGVT